MSPTVSNQRSAELAGNLWEALKTRADLTRETAMTHLGCSSDELDAAIKILFEAMDYAEKETMDYVEKRVANYHNTPKQKPSKEMRDLFAFA